MEGEAASSELGLGGGGGGGGAAGESASASSSSSSLRISIISSLVSNANNKQQEVNVKSLVWCAYLLRIRPDSP